MVRQLPTALITGASSGIGRELARRFAEDHHQLILVARDRARMESLAEELHRAFLVPVRVETCDLSVRTEVERLISKLQSENCVVDVLVNNAGVGVDGPFALTDWEREKSMIDLNVLSLVQLTKAFLPQMLSRRKGRILQVASTAAFQPGPFLSVYFATKAFVLSFSEALSAEVRGSGVTITALCPGPTFTEFERRLGPDSKLFSTGLPVADVHSVALYGYQCLMRGKRVAIPGIMNRVLVWVSNFTPHAVILFVMAKMMSKRTSLRPTLSKDRSVRCQVGDTQNDRGD